MGACAQQYTYAYGEPIPVEQMIVQICDKKQGYTQFGGLRPFGVSFLFAGYDKHHGFQLYHTDPSGNYSGWKATAIGVNNQTATTVLRQEWKEDMTLDEGLLLVSKCLVKTLDTTTPTADKLEFGVLVKKEDGSVGYRSLGSSEVSKLIEAAQPERRRTRRIPASYAASSSASLRVARPLRSRWTASCSNGCSFAVQLVFAACCAASCDGARRCREGNSWSISCFRRQFSKRLCSTRLHRFLTPFFAIPFETNLCV